jgi:hypothetical protein
LEELIFLDRITLVLRIDDPKVEKLRRYFFYGSYNKELEGLKLIPLYFSSIREPIELHSIKQSINNKKRYWHKARGVICVIGYGNSDEKVGKIGKILSDMIKERVKSHYLFRNCYEYEIIFGKKFYFDVLF